jgi:hypothetical protein
MNDVISSTAEPVAQTPTPLIPPPQGVEITIEKLLVPDLSKLSPFVTLILRDATLPKVLIRLYAGEIHVSIIHDAQANALSEKFRPKRVAEALTHVTQYYPKDKQLFRLER